MMLFLEATSSRASNNPLTISPLLCRVAFIEFNETFHTRHCVIVLAEGDAKRDRRRLRKDPPVAVTALTA